MIPNFNSNKWDRDKVLDYVIKEQPLDDQQISFLIYLENLQKENERLKEEQQELIHLVTNKVIADYDYDNILKQQLNKERLKYITLNDNKNEIENILTEFEKWLEEQNVASLNGNFTVIRLADIKKKLQELKRR